MNDALVTILLRVKEWALEGEFTPEKSRFVEYVDSLGELRPPVEYQKAAGE